MRFKEFLEAVEDDKDFKFKTKKKLAIKVKDKIDPRLDPHAEVDPGNKTPSAMNLKALLGQVKYDKKTGHIGTVASAVGVYPT
jgi:hypothetical protein